MSILTGDGVIIGEKGSTSKKQGKGFEYSRRNGDRKRAESRKKTEEKEQLYITQHITITITYT